MKGRDFTKRLSRWAKRSAEDIDAAAMGLVANARAAGRLRGYQRDPAVAALNVERSRDGLDSWGWFFVILGLSFTTVNVHDFVARTAAFLTLLWVVAWVVEPVVMGLMLVLLRGEQLANRHGEQADSWVRMTRWVLLLITYVMNTARAWGEGDKPSIFIDSAVVVVVFLTTEALAKQRQTLTKVVDKVSRGDTIVPVEKPVWRPSPTPRTVVPAVLPQTVDERKDETPDQETPDREPDRTQDLSGPRTLVEQAYAAYAALRRETGAAPTPSQVDDRAGVRRGTSKVTGRMARFAVRYEEEVSRGTEGDAEATG